MMLPLKGRFASKTVVIALGVIAVAVVLIANQIFRQSGDSSAAGSAQKPTGPLSMKSIATMSMDDWKLRIDAAATGDFRSLIENAMQITDASLRRKVITSIVDRWLREDVSGFSKYWASLEVNGADAKLAMVALALQDSLTNLDPELAASDEIFVVVQRLISYLAGTDPDKALVWAKQWLMNDALDQAKVSIARGMAKTDIDKALSIIDEMTSTLRRGQALAAVGGIWAAKDVEAATRWASGLKNPAERALTMNAVLMTTAQNDASMAANQLKAEAKSMNDEYVRERNKDLAEKGVSEIDMANDPETYKEMLANGNVSTPYSPDVELMGESGKVVGSKLGEKDGSNAADWATSLETDYLKLKSLAGALEGWAKTDPYAAVEYLKNNYPNNSDLLTSLYSSWAANDAYGAADATMMIDDPTLRALALESVVKTWSTSGNPQDVVNYLRDIPAAENTDAVKLAAANAISQSSPQQAWEIAQTISGESAQLRALKAAFANMVIQNPAQAGALLDSASLSENASVRLRDMLDAVVGN